MTRWVFALVLLLGCQPPPPEGATQIPPPRVCSGQAKFTLDEPYGRLLCDDVCPDGTPCRELFSDTGDHSWCGCPGQPEPSQCHIVAVKTADDWVPDCTGACPLDEPCREDRRWEDSDGGVVSCECLARDE